MINESEIEHIIAKVISGNADPEETRIVNNWAGKTTDNRKLLLEMVRSWELSKSFLTDLDISKARLKIENQILSRLK